MTETADKCSIIRQFFDDAQDALTVHSPIFKIHTEKTSSAISLITVCYLFNLLCFLLYA